MAGSETSHRPDGLCLHLESLAVLNAW